MSILKLTHVRKVFTDESSIEVEALKDINLEVQEGEFVAIMGESGAGKTTLLNIIATLDKPTSGEIFLKENNLQKLKENAAAKFRREHLGFIFQHFNLLDTFNNKDNILLPLVLAKTKPAEMHKRLKPLAKILQIEDLLERYPYEISGGQRQRIAAARALITRPDLLLADEPTGALDSATATKMLELLELVNQNGQTIVMVTHSAKAASYATRTLFIKDGKIYHELFKGEMSRKQYLEKISQSLLALNN